MKRFAQILLTIVMALSVAFAFTACNDADNNGETTTKMTVVLVKADSDDASVNAEALDENETEYYSITGFSFSQEDTEILAHVAKDKMYYSDSYDGLRKDSESYKKEKTRYNEQLKKLATLTVPSVIKTAVKESKINLTLEQLNAATDGVIDVSVGDADAKSIKIRSIEANAMLNHTEIEELVVSDTCLYIGSAAFGGCSSLKKITLPFVGEQNGALNAKKSFGYIFGTVSYDGGVSVTQNYNASGTATYYLPEHLTEVTVNNTIGKYAFHNASTIKAINFSATDKIADYAFYGCSALENVALTSTVTEIGEAAFQGCTSLRSVNLENVKVYKNSAFQGCTSLCYSDKKLTLSSTVTEIGEKAFYGCSAIEEITAVSTGATVKTAAFASMSSLKKATLGNLTLCAAAFASWSDMLTVTANGCEYFGGDYNNVFVGAFEENNVYNQKVNFKLN